MTREHLHIAPRVVQALDAGWPIVALESTIIAHGMPHPANVETALAVEQIVERGGAVPATIGILDGRIIVGLSHGEIERMASGGAMKACERDIPLAAARKADAATTAGASIAITAAAGIRVFVTGGIGAVGPQAATDFDISADLPALAQYPVLTVCAGAKAFMDIGATLEWLETWRVPVATWKTPTFPLFYSRDSGHRNAWAAQSAEEIAAAFAAKLTLGAPGGMLVAVPLPESDAIPEARTRQAIDAALNAAAQQGVRGKALTPFLLAHIQESTGGESLRANIALIRNNAAVGAAIATALAKH